MLGSVVRRCVGFADCGGTPRRWGFRIPKLTKLLQPSTGFAWSASLPGPSEAARAEKVRQLRAEAISKLLFEQQAWQLRKVQSHQLQNGNYAVVRVSIDCIPQELPGLEYMLGGSGDGASLIVPVTYMDRSTLRQFDMRGLNGESLPVIGRSEYTDWMLDVLAYQIEPALTAEPHWEVVQAALTTILDGEVDTATKLSEHLIESGTVEGLTVLRAESLSAFAKELLRALARSYVLFVLVPRDYAQRRVVIKYSYQADQKRADGNGRDRWRSAAGLAPIAVTFELTHPTGAASHHLEVSVPADLSCSVLRMPGSYTDRNTENSSEGGVVHAVSSYTEDPDTPALAEFEVPWRGMRATTWLISATTFVILYLGLVLPGAQHALLEGAGGAGTLLLGVIAVAVAFAAGRRESAVESALLGPLRTCVLGCSLLLLACATSIVGGLHEPFRISLWSFGAALTGTLTITLCAHEGKARWGAGWRWLVGFVAVVAAVLLACGVLLW